MSKKKAFALAFSCLLGFAVACSNQGEGDRCNSDDDCGTNLTCVARATLADTSTRVCCPTGGDSTNEFCNVNPSDTNQDASGPILDPDASTDADAESNSSSSGGSSSGGSSSGGSSSGGGADASTDAGSDADAS